MSDDIRSADDIAASQREFESVLRAFMPSDVRLAHAVLDVEIAIADFMLLIVTSESSSELERIRTETDRLIASLEAVASSALDRAERL